MVYFPCLTSGVSPRRRTALRKAILPASKDAKKPEKRARFVGDKLLVKGHFVTPNTSQRAYDMPGEHEYLHYYVCVDGCCTSCDNIITFNTLQT